MNAQCSEYSPRRCMCGGYRQNSVQLMPSRLGSASEEPPVEEPADTTPPAVALVSPDDGATLEGNTTIEVRATASDDVALSRVELVWHYGGSRIVMDCDAPPSQVTCSTSGDTSTWRILIGTGPRSFSARAVDDEDEGRVDEGGEETGDPEDNLSPHSSRVSVISPESGTEIAPGDRVQVRAEATDNRDVAQVWLWWILESGETGAYPLRPLGGNTWGIDLTLASNAAPGTRTLRIAAYDRVGNRTVAPDMVLTVVP